MRREDLVKEIDPEKLKVNNIVFIIILFVLLIIYLFYIRLLNGLKAKKETLEHYLVHCIQYYGKVQGGTAISVIL